MRKDGMKSSPPIIGIGIVDDECSSAKESPSSTPSLAILLEARSTSTGDRPVPQ
jgi:hypothetical protein